MSRSGGISQLFKGILIGILLILAIVGTMSLLDKGSPFDTKQHTKAPEQSSEIIAPSITLNPNKERTLSSNNNIDISEKESSDKRQEQADIQAQSIESKPAESPQVEAEKPTLENERKPEDITKKIEYGMLTLSAVNPENRQKLKANFTVFDKDNKKVAESNNSENSSYRLPVGQYKVVTTLNATEAGGRPVPQVRKSQYLIVRPNSTSKQTFELEPPSTIGVLQVSATVNNKNIRANFIIQKENGETVASRNNVTNSLFKLKAGSYKVTVRSGNTTDFRTVVVESGESTKEVFALKEAISQGRVLVRVFDTRSNTPIPADISIKSYNGKIVQELKAVTKAELALSTGNYQLNVIGPTGKSNKNITVNAGQVSNEVFRFDLPQENTVSIQEPVVEPQKTENKTTQISETVTIKPVEQSANTQADGTNTIDNSLANLTVLAKDAESKKPIRSNIYIQTTTGKHLDKKIYVTSGNFQLPAGTYKVTVRAKDRKNSVRTIRLSDKQTLNQTFLLEDPNFEQQATTTPLPSAIPTGFLNVSMLSPRNRKVSHGELNAHFIVATAKGKKIVELTSVSNGNFKLDTGIYRVTAIHKNKRRSQQVTVKANQNSRVSFNSSDFEANKGVLRSRIVDDSGRALKGDLTVTNERGQVVARANNVSTGVFDLPPTAHTVSVNFRGLSGRERVNILSGETTIQTFTIAPNRRAPNNNVPDNRNTTDRNSSREIRKILTDKIKEEIRRNF